MIILVDIDHVLSDATWRDTMIENGDSWDSYHAASFMDKPIPEIVAMIKSLRWAHYDIVAITERPEKWRNLTMQWLTKHQIPIDQILMRPDDNFDQAPELKLHLCQNMKAVLAFILEDRDDVCAAFKEAGFTVLQVHRNSR